MNPTAALVEKTLAVVYKHILNPLKKAHGMNVLQSVIDDRDPSIIYIANWNRANFSFDFNSTTTFTTERGAAAVIPFFGMLQ